MRLFGIKKGIIVASISLIVIVLSEQNTCHAVELDALTRRCENEYSKMVSGKDLTRDEAPKLISKWKTFGGVCKGTGMYEFRMGNLYRLAGDNNKAKQILESALSEKVKYSNYVRTELLDIKFNELLYSGAQDRSKYEAIVHQLSTMAEKDNTTTYIYGQLATDQIILQDWQGAINSATKALLIDNNSEIALRTLVIAFSKTGKYHLAQRTIDKVAPLYPDLKADVAFDFAAARTYVALGAPKISESILKVLVHYHPQVKNDRGFKAIEVEVKNALAGK